jgi:hypothetical protein
MCDAAEKKLFDLKCTDRHGNLMWVNKNGEKFGDTCRTVQQSGGVFLNPSCITNASTCQEANTCPPATD